MINLSKTLTPIYVCEEQKLIGNLELLQQLQADSGCRILLALKGFAMFSLFPIVKQYLIGAAASSINEARLASEEMGGELHAYSPAFKTEDIQALIPICDHIVFNSYSQWNTYRNPIRTSGRSIDIGIRINTQVSTVSPAIYDPHCTSSRLGITRAQFNPQILQDLQGAHFHALCGGSFDDLVKNITSLEQNFPEVLQHVKWLNLGGGHALTRPTYPLDKLAKFLKDFGQKHELTIYLEPSEAIAYNTGSLIASVVDIVHNDMNIAILDVSAAAHMPDVLEMPYRPEIVQSSEFGTNTYRLTGNTCLAGDIIGDYAFKEPLKPGDKLEFLDMIHYTMVKNNTFNGVGLPAIGVWTRQGEFKLVREFGYKDYKGRLS